MGSTLNTIMPRLTTMTGETRSFFTKRNMMR